MTFASSRSKHPKRSKTGNALITVENNPWSKVSTPAPGDAHPIGFYAAGCLQGAVPLLDGPGYLVMHRERARFYSHPEMIDFIHRLGLYVLNNESTEPYSSTTTSPRDTLLVGDIAMVRGGPTLSRHASHQTGLDADIWFKLWPAGMPYPHIPEYSLADKQAVPLLEQNEIQATAKRAEDGADVSIDAPLMVNWPYLYARFKEQLRKRNRKVYYDSNLILSALSPDWGPTQERILKMAALDPRVERIFVDPVIKKKFCVSYPDDHELLRKLRPEWSHWDHFHVRLACPVGDTLCKPQPPSLTDGCNDKTLERDFFNHIQLPSTPSAPLPKHFMPKLPDACQPVLHAQ